MAKTRKSKVRGASLRFTFKSKNGCVASRLSNKRQLRKRIHLIKQNNVYVSKNVHFNEDDLIQSIIDCDVVALERILENGIAINEPFTGESWTPMHYACFMIEPPLLGTDRHVELIRLLLEYGADINVRDDNLWTPLHLTCELGVTRLIWY